MLSISFQVRGVRRGSRIPTRLARGLDCLMSLGPGACWWLVQAFPNDEVSWFLYPADARHGDGSDELDCCALPRAPAQRLLQIP